MVRLPWTIAGLLVLGACGGSDKKPVTKPVAKEDKPKPPKKLTEADREAQRRESAHELIPDGSTCLPASLKDSPVMLEVAAIKGELRVCGIDTKPDRLLGMVACWKVNLKTQPPSLEYTEAAPIPGRGFSVQLDGRCARGFCLPKDARETDAEVAHMAWSLDGAKVAVVVGDDVNVFDAKTKAHESVFSVRADNGVTNEPRAVHWTGGVVFVEGADDGPFSAVWAYKPDGTPVGPITAIGSTKPSSTYRGSFLMLDDQRIAIAERGFSTMTIYEAGTGKRAKLVRKLARPPCKSAQLEAFWTGGEVDGKCAAHMNKEFGHLIGATGVSGSKSFVIALRGNRIGELGLLDLKNLKEKSALKLPWCPAEKEKDEDDDKPSKKKKNSKASDDDGDEDPDAGGE